MEKWFRYVHFQYSRREAAERGCEEVKRGYFEDYWSPEMVPGFARDVNYSQNIKPTMQSDLTAKILAISTGI